MQFDTLNFISEIESEEIAKLDARNDLSYKHQHTHT
jgi:hypothetical protein